MLGQGRRRTGAFGILLVLSAGTASPQSTASVTVDSAAARHPIDPRIYGVAFASSADLAALNCPLHRWGGNATTQYNWAQNADNRGSDWYFQSIPGGSATPGASADDFIGMSRTAGAQPMMTLPMIGWVAKVSASRQKLAAFSIAKYGAQTDADWQWFPDAGNGILTNGQLVVNDPNDASVPADAEFQRGWVRHLVGRWGAASAGGLRYYVLDNEHSLWHTTHRAVHPTGARMEEVRDKIVAYSSMVKWEDPSALVVGPEEWGWSGYLFSGFDLQWGGQHGWSNLPDRSAHGGMDYLPWLLEQLRLHEQQSGGPRLLDVFAVHYYPQGGEFGNDTSAAMQQRRNRSTRSLWDPNYVDETWINDRVRLIPRLKGWAATHYRSGTPVGITEYNWGAEGHMSGATAQADVLGIFGREGLDLATRWTTPPATSPTYKAMQMYRNYDGQRSTFGEVSVAAGGPNPDQLAVFAALRSSDGALTVMLVHKNLTGTTTANVTLAGFQAQGSAQVWRLTSSNAIQRLADAAVTGGVVSTTLPAQSVTLLVVPATGGGTPTPTPRPTATPTATSTPTPTRTPTPTVTPTGTPTPTPTPTTPTTTPTPRPLGPAILVNGGAAPVTVTPGAVVTVQVSGGPAFPHDWVGQYVSTAVHPTQSFLAWKYLNGLQTPPAVGLSSATITFAMPSTPGTYNFRFFRNEGYALLATSPLVTVATATPTSPPAAASVSVNGASSPVTVAPGATVTLGISGGPAFPHDWVGQYVSTAVHPTHSFLAWKFLNGAPTPPAAGMSSATITFAMPTTPGTYNFRLFQNNGYTLLATSPAVTVSATAPTPRTTPAPTIAVVVNGSASPITVARGATVSVGVSGGPAFVHDWVGQYVTSAIHPANAFLAWKYLNGMQTPPGTGLSAATLMFTMPSTPGAYNFRFFQNEGYTLLATSPTVTVSP